MSQPVGALAPKPSRDEKEIAVAKKMFIAGCFFLPWLWILLLVKFRKRWSDRDCHPQLKKFLRWSLIGVIIDTCLLTIWIAVFRTQYSKWGTAGTNLLVWSPSNQWWL